MSKQDNDYTVGKWFVIGVFACVILFAGEPDIADSIMSLIQTLAQEGKSDA